MKKIFVILIFFYSFSFGFGSKCKISTSCESDLRKMSQEIQEKIDNEFDKLEDSIDKVKETHNSIIAELDKEIYLLNMILKGEVALYRKLNQIEFLTKQSSQIKGIDISMIYNINQLLKKREEKQNGKNK